MKYIEPKKNLSVFTCPHCKTVSSHNWKDFKYQEDVNLSLEAMDVYKRQISVKEIEVYHLFFSRCFSCYNKTVWINEVMVYPKASAPEPNLEMPLPVLEIYKEAEKIYIDSPRGACALLRLSIQILCKELGEKGKNINDDISSLVKKGLPVAVQQALDVVRVIGNNAVHPGTIDTDNKETAIQLFELVNIIVQYMIQMPNKTKDLFEKLPKYIKESISKRDSK